MPNKKGGKNYKKSKKSSGMSAPRKGDIERADNKETIYASVIRRLGGSRVEVKCNDKIVRQGIIPGAFYRRVWLNPGDVLLVQISPLKPTECYVLYKYLNDEIQILRSTETLTFDVSLTNESDGEDDMFDLADDNSDDDNSDNEETKESIPAPKKESPKKEDDGDFDIDDI